MTISKLEIAEELMFPLESFQNELSNTCSFINDCLKHNQFITNICSQELIKQKLSSITTSIIAINTQAISKDFHIYKYNDLHLDIMETKSTLGKIYKVVLDRFSSEESNKNESTENILMFIYYYVIFILNCEKYLNIKYSFELASKMSPIEKLRKRLKKDYSLYFPKEKEPDDATTRKVRFQGEASLQLDILVDQIKEVLHHPDQVAVDDVFTIQKSILLMRSLVESGIPSHNASKTEHELRVFNLREFFSNPSPLLNSAEEDPHIQPWPYLEQENEIELAKSILNALELIESVSNLLKSPPASLEDRLQAFKLFLTHLNNVWNDVFDSDCLRLFPEILDSIDTATQKLMAAAKIDLGNVFLEPNLRTPSNMETFEKLVTSIFSTFSHRKKPPINLRSYRHYKHFIQT